MSKPYAVLRGDFFIREKGTSENFYAFGNVADAEVTMSAEFATLESSGNERGTLHKEETKRTMGLKVTASSQIAKNLRLYFYAKSVQAQAAAEDVAFTLPAMVAGEAFPLAVGVSNVVVTGKTEGVDYKVLPKSGILVALAPIAADTAGTYDNAAGSVLGPFSGDETTEYEVLYASESSGKQILFRRWVLNPASTVKLIDSNVGSFPIDGELLIDTSIAEGPLGRYAVVKDSLNV